MTKEELFDYLLKENVILQQNVDDYIPAGYIENSINHKEFQLSSPVLHLLQTLVKEDILMVIADQLILTNKYKEILMKEKTSPSKPEDRFMSLQEVKVSSPSTFITEKEARKKARDITDSPWPSSIITANPNTLLSNFYSVCNIPMSPKGQNYRLRNGSSGTRSTINKIVRNYVELEIDPVVFIQCITDYYTQVTLPQSIKSLFETVEGAVNLYNEYVDNDNRFFGSQDNNGNNQNLL